MIRFLRVLAICLALGASLVGSSYARDTTPSSRRTPPRLPDVALPQQPTTPATPPGVPVPYPQTPSVPDRPQSPR
jgi:hypothetical protein